MIGSGSWFFLSTSRAVAVAAVFGIVSVSRSRKDGSTLQSSVHAGGRYETRSSRREFSRRRERGALRRRVWRERPASNSTGDAERVATGRSLSKHASCVALRLLCLGVRPCPTDFLAAQICAAKKPGLSAAGFFQPTAMSVAAAVVEGGGRKSGGVLGNCQRFVAIKIHDREIGAVLAHVIDPIKIEVSRFRAAVLLHRYEMSHLFNLHAASPQRTRLKVKFAACQFASL